MPSELNIQFQRQYPNSAEKIEKGQNILSLKLDAA
jgi:hypothetical protein